MLAHVHLFSPSARLRERMRNVPQGTREREIVPICERPFHIVGAKRAKL
jgi:hypothetical protein